MYNNHEECNTLFKTIGLQTTGRCKNIANSQITACSIKISAFWNPIFLNNILSSSLSLYATFELIKMYGLQGIHYFENFKKILWKSNFINASWCHIASQSVQPLLRSKLFSNQNKMASRGKTQISGHMSNLIFFFNWCAKLYPRIFHSH